MFPIFIFSAPWFAKVLTVDAEAYASSVIQTSDGGYLIGGDIEDPQTTNPDLFLIKLSKEGSLEWAKIYETTVGHLSFLIQTSDGGYALAGSTWYPLNVKSEFLLVKLKPDGSVEWARSYGGRLHDEANSIIQTKERGYLLIGETRSYGSGESDVLVIRTDPRGNPIWAKAYGGEGNESARSAVMVEDGYVLAGTTTSFGSGGEDILVMRISADGSLKWANAYGFDAYEEAFSLVQADKKGYFISGWTDSFVPDGDRDALFIRLRPDGSLMWAKRLGLPENWEEARSLVQARDKGLVAACFAEIPRGWSQDILVVKVTESGELAWAKTFGDNSERDMASSLIQAKDGGLVIAGTTSVSILTNFLVLKISPEGKGLNCLMDYSPEVSGLELRVSPSGLSVEDCSVFSDPQEINIRTPGFIRARDLCE
ncbi:MAG: hypothetical protein ABIN66_00270 [candidate division WOR-3 bacterium]